MRMLAALLLSGLLAVMAYGIFWLVCLNLTTDQMRAAVKNGLGADLSYGRASWVPDPKQVTMQIPNVTMVLQSGPIREVKVANLQLSSNFLKRDRWRMVVPAHVDVTMANGRKLQLVTTGGEVVWRESESMTLRAETLRVLDEQGKELAAFDDVVMARGAGGGAVNINLASRPYVNGVQGVLSGQIVMPSAAFAKVLDLFGRELPGLGEILETVVVTMQSSGGGVLGLKNVSFRFGQDMNGAINGDVEVMADGKAKGNVAVTADSLKQLVSWLKDADLISPRSPMEAVGASRVMQSLAGKHPTVTVENMQTTLVLNGNPVGPLPVAREVVRNLWR